MNTIISENQPVKITIEELTSETEQKIMEQMFNPIQTTITSVQPVITNYTDSIEIKL